VELQADRGRTGGGGLWRGYGQLVALGWPMALLWRRSILLRGSRRGWDWDGWRGSGRRGAYRALAGAVIIGSRPAWRAARPKP
jgi:hypothetical protein